MKFETLMYAVEETVATITINRPDKLNALNKQVFKDLTAVLDEIGNSQNVHGVIITGAGPKSFVAGADITEIQQLNASTAKDFSTRGQNVLNRIENLGKPVIAAVNGFALGGGCELAMACTLRVASESAKFGQPEVNLGIIPGYGGTQRLVRLIGKGRAMEMILTGDMIDAREAYRIGLVNKVVPAVELMPEARLLVNKILSKGQIAVRYSIEAINASDSILCEGLSREAALFGLSATTDDAHEGIEAFLEKRFPKFKQK
ncbi:MAG: enoyl-CoA hydratase/isomerase family protein [Bacteroidetes bacterium]|nr:enoyl-CoA hydratase/isomerase family protein [Bacteroidota bacterium]